MVGGDLPTRFHIGTQRAGSSFVYNLLSAHPQVSLSPAQEVHFFTRNFDQGLDWYKSNFTPGRTSIDTSPKYFHRGEVVAARINKLLGAEVPRFLLILRNPIDYLFSHWQMHRRQGVFERQPAKYPAVPEDFVDFLARYPDYVGRARYGSLLSQYWFATFPRDRFHVSLFEEFVADPQEAMHEVLIFFGLEPLRLSTSVSSQNRTLRHPLLYRTRDLVSRLGPVKQTLKRSALFDRLYDRFLAERAAGLDPHQRTAVAELLVDDVMLLRDVLGRDLDRWTDFADFPHN